MRVETSSLSVLPNERQLDESQGAGDLKSTLTEKDEERLANNAGLSSFLFPIFVIVLVLVESMKVISFRPSTEVFGALWRLGFVG